MWRLGRRAFSSFFVRDHDRPTCMRIWHGFFILRLYNSALNNSSDPYRAVKLEQIFEQRM